MGLPTVHHDRIVAGTNSSLISAFAPKLHALLVAAGWTILYANADAIGSGSSSNPAWDKTPATNASAGKTIYRMPANDHTRQWCVQIEHGWGTSTANNLTTSITVGTDWDGTSALIDAGGTITYASNASTLNLEVLISTSEDGFAFAYAGNTTSLLRWALVERPRAFDGQVTDDLAISGYAVGGTFPSSNIAYGCARYRASDGLEYTAAPWAALAHSQGPTSWQGPASGGGFTSADGETGLPIGPLTISGIPAALPRLLLLIHAQDAVAASDHPVFVDEDVRLYRTPVSLVSSAYVTVLARE